MSTQFDSTSTDAMFATLIAKQEASDSSRERFRIEIREQFHQGTLRMDKQDVVLAAIEEQARKTNGRVTRIEDAELNRRMEVLELAEIAHRNAAATQKGALWVIGGVVSFVTTCASALATWWLAKH